MEVLFNELEIPVEEYSFGRSKIFIRNPRTVCNRNLYTVNLYYNHIGKFLTMFVTLPEMLPRKPHSLIYLQMSKRGWSIKG